MKKLPDAEFELMQIIWNNPCPISTNQIIDKLENPAQWKAQTVLSFLSRLEEKGFIESQRAGRERLYMPAVEQQEYLTFEYGQFMRKFQASSFMNLVNTLYQNKNVSKQDLQAIQSLLDEEG